MKETYDAQQIQILEGLEHVRKRPSMYIGSTGEDGLHHLVYEVIDNSIDEVLGGYCSHIAVKIGKNNIITVTDNGRGIPVDKHQVEKISALEIVMTRLHAGGKFDKKSYKVSGGLHGVGVSVVNALSEWCKVYVHRNKKIYYQKYNRGAPEEDVTVIGKTDKTGTVTIFRADEKIFEKIVYSFDMLSNRLRELAFLNRGVQITIVDERDEKQKSHTFHFNGGVKSFIEYVNKNKNPIHSEPIHFESTKDDVFVEIAIEYNDGYSESIFTYANNINTKEGGTHLSGFKAGLTRTLNDFLRKQKGSKK